MANQGISPNKEYSGTFNLRVPPKLHAQIAARAAAEGKSLNKCVTDQVVEKRKFKNLKTECEHVAEFEYRPGKCKKPYRMIVLRKTIKVLKGQCQLFDDIRYFFYITNDDKKSVEQLIQFYRNRTR